MINSGESETSLEESYTHRGIRESFADRIKFNVAVAVNANNSEHSIVIIEKRIATVEEQFQRETIADGTQAQYEDESSVIKTNLGIISRYRLTRVNTSTGTEEEVSALTEAGLQPIIMPADPENDYIYRAELLADRAAALNSITVAEGVSPGSNRAYEYHFQKYSGAFTVINRILPPDDGLGGVASLRDAYTSLFSSTEVPGVVDRTNPTIEVSANINYRLKAVEYNIKMSSHASRQDINFFIVRVSFAGVIQPLGIILPESLDIDAQWRTAVFLDRTFFARPGVYNYSLGYMTNDFSFRTIPGSAVAINTEDSGYYFLENGEAVPMDSVELSQGDN